LKIVGVRPKPEGLDDNMRVNPAVKQILQMQMQAQGYFIGGDKEGNERLYSNEGELIAGINNGVQYTLYFGEIARGTGKEIEVGLGDETKPDETKDDEDNEEGEDETSDDGPRRYLLVKADFNEALLGDKPVAPVEPAKPEILNEAAKEEAVENSKDAAPAKEDDSNEEQEESAEDGSCGPDEEDAAEGTAKEDEPEAKTETEPPAVEKAATEESKADAPADEKKPAAEAPADEQPAGDKPPNDDKPAAETKEEEKPAEPEKDPKQIAQEEYDAAMGEYEAQKTAYDSDLKKYEDKVKEGQEKATELSTRFAGWYYVISSDSFEKFRIERKDVVSKKEVEAEKEAENADGDKEPGNEK